MELMHNTLFRVLEPSQAGLFRVVLDFKLIGKMAVVRLDPVEDINRKRGGRKRLANTKQKRRKPRQAMLTRIKWFDYSDLELWSKEDLLIVLDEQKENIEVSVKDKPLYERRKLVMTPFLDVDVLRDNLMLEGGISVLLNQVVKESKASEPFVRQCFSLLARLGFCESSLKPRRDRCGAPGVSRPCDPDGRQKSGRKTNAQRIENAFTGVFPPPKQPGNSSLWTKLVLAADKLIPKPKPAMPERCRQIVSSSFIKRYKHEGGKLIEVDPAEGSYPNSRQIRRVLEREIPRLERLLERTTKGHFSRSMRGLTGRNWQGVSGPGHTWAIDSTIGDIYLRSSIDRSWIIGRPIVYVIVDVWSTAVVGFYVCLEGPSWPMAKISLFSSAASTELLTDLWGFPTELGLSPAPTMCAVLMCDRGEYLCKAARITGAKLIPCLSYAPPYRPDGKGLVEVLHRITKDRMYFFVPGAIDFRRKEFELRRFNPDEAVLTLKEFVAYLYTTFLEYNLTASRQHRLDAHMKAAGVFPCPAGLWRYGHEIGIGVRRNVLQSELITELLPSATARVTRHGVRFAGCEYSSNIINAQQWTAHARNFCGWDVTAHHFPGTMSRIWTPPLDGSGLLNLRLSDTSNASPELTFDEVIDANTYATIFNGNVEHANMLVHLDSIRRRQDVVANAKRLTEQALAKASGSAKPTLTEARKMEVGDSSGSAQPASAPEPNFDQAEADHAEMMEALLAIANTGDDGDAQDH